MEIVKDKLLLGTVVSIKDEIALYMIIGYAKKEENIDSYYMVPFPYGLMSDKCIFNYKNEDIEKIIFEGLNQE